jgi:hypothetical protein
MSNHATIIVFGAGLAGQAASALFEMSEFFRGKKQRGLDGLLVVSIFFI